VVTPGNAQAGAAASGLGELGKPASTDPAAATTDDAQKRQLVTEQMEALKESKHVLRANDKGPEVVLLQQQLKQLGLHIKETGVMDKDTQAIIKAIQTGGGLGPDGVVGPKTIDQLLALDKLPSKPEEPAQADDKVDHMPDDPKLAAVYLFNRMRVRNANESLTPQQEKDMEQFIKNWDANKARYEKVAETAGIPPKLIAALHWRESTGDFGTYLHQGDPLGKRSTSPPTSPSSKSGSRRPSTPWGRRQASRARTRSTPTPLTRRRWPATPSAITASAITTITRWAARMSSRAPTSTPRASTSAMATGMPTTRIASSARWR
jgi:hypothetical protein